MLLYQLLPQFFVLSVVQCYAIIELTDSNDPPLIPQKIVITE